jgi:hypothetical protein
MCEKTNYNQQAYGSYERVVQMDADAASETDARTVLCRYTIL